MDSTLWERFTNEDFNLLPSSDLEKFNVLTQEEAIARWTDTVGPYKHLMLVPANKWFFSDRFVVDWDNVEGGRRLINERLKSILSPNLIVLWNPRSGVNVPFEIFLKYWDDFCYPSDDNIVLINPNHDQFVTFCEENIHIQEKVDSD